ncbi:related to RNA helicase MPH1 [Cephalotrichum gorgonifer]|uniref:ATP-dependent DNA helicase n=1 Tax=Cephalotrichum gorgonifer TaxID=2041049 RepID=A0AAE8SRI7_9PEZI|nr:related to RNA helicase MPH1 [Cephalotrichum gorgonifer]
MDDYLDDDIDDDDLMLAADEAINAISSTPSIPQQSQNQTVLRAPSPQPRPARTLERQISISRQNTLSQPGQGQGRLQTTLDGNAIDDEEFEQSIHPTARGVYRNDPNREALTHHELDNEALRTWVYPTNLGATREYQYSIVSNSLFNNTLVALPTGLGKTFIAATVMLNFYRWTKSAQIVFVAPTKPLVSQQVEACFNIVGIPRSDTTLLTGDVSPGLRAEEWGEKRVFFMTPQTLHNDLCSGFADPKRIVLLVVDEAHRAVGEYAYAKVIKFIRRFSKSVRVLALTATPGSKVETVQEVIDNLGISHVEIRTEESMDIRQYVHRRDIETEILDPSDEINQVRDLFTKALQPLVDKLTQQNIYWGRDAMSLTTYGLVKASQDWYKGPGRHANQGVQNMLRAVFSVLQSVAHSIKLLNFHGIKPFFDSMATIRSEVEDAKGKGSKYRSGLIKDQNFVEMMVTIDKWLQIPDFAGHPKLTVLTNKIMEHFVNNPSQGSSTKVIVFSEYRDSAEEIVRILNMHQPLMRARVFVGQADSKRSEGMKQAQQIQAIEDFKAGKFNVLVATSIGEEGLDIGQVDLIVCYDASSSPIRMLQRMGRTGRKRAGRIILLLMRGKEEDNYSKSKDSYAAMQKLICEGSKFAFRYDISTRIVPKGVKPEVDLKMIEIPLENTQVQGLPEPRKNRAPKKKKPPKKFHMPDGVPTGFMKASEINKSVRKKARAKTPDPVETDVVVDVPALESVALTPAQQNEFKRLYQLVPGKQSSVVQVRMDAFPKLQRELRPTVHVKHGNYTKRVVKMLSRVAAFGDKEVEYPPLDPPPYRHLDIPEFVDTDAGSQGGSESPKIIQLSEEEEERPNRPKKRKQARKNTPTSAPRYGFDVSDLDEEKERRTRPKKRKQGKKDTFKSVPSYGGDVCDSDEEIPGDDNDDGEDLLDFIVSDSWESPQPKSREGPRRGKGKGEGKGGKSGDHVVEGSSDEDMPTLSQLLDPAPKPVAPKQAWVVDSDDDDDVGSGMGGDRVQLTQRGRMIIEDSDEDEWG